MDFKVIAEATLKDITPELKAIAGKLLFNTLFPIIEEAVAKSDTKVDDAVMLALGPTLKAAIASFLEQK
jgi:hypothetical protein